MSYFSEKLYELRKEKGFSQEELAEKLNVARQTISKWENGTTNPDTNNLIELSKIFEISIDELVGNDAFTAKENLEEKNDEYNNKKCKFKRMKMIFVILISLVVLVYLGIIAYRTYIVIKFQINLISNREYLGKDYSYHESEIGFSDVGLNDKWEFINAKTKNDTFIIEYYKTEFDVNKDSFEPDKTRVEFYDGKDYYDINMIEKVYSKETKVISVKYLYNLTLINIDTKIGGKMNEEFLKTKIPMWKFVFDLSNEIQIENEENGNKSYMIKFKNYNGFSLRDMRIEVNNENKVVNMRIALDNGTNLLNYESSVYSWEIIDEKDTTLPEVKLPDLTGFTLIENK